MKYIFYSLIIFSVTSCATSKYEYDLDILKPVYSKELNFSDDKISIDFVLNEFDISLKVKNNSDKPFKIIWDEASFVKNGEAQKIMHKNIKFMDKEKNQAPTVIPSNSFINETIQPIDDIKFSTSSYSKGGQYRWSTEPIFLVSRQSSKKKILSYLGNTINIYLPIQFDGKTIDYYFEMQVKDILLRKGKSNVESIIDKTIK
jgi:hypothetical protein